MENAGGMPAFLSVDAFHSNLQFYISGDFGMAPARGAALPKKNIKRQKPRRNGVKRWGKNPWAMPNVI
jgi:hypothetical protein